MPANMTHNEDKNQLKLRTDPDLRIRRQEHENKLYCIQYNYVRKDTAHVKRRLKSIF